MEFSYLGMVNRVLMMGQQSPIDALLADYSYGSWGYKAQIAVNDAITDLSLSLRLKSRKITFNFSTVVGQRLYNLPRQVLWPLIELRQTDSPIALGEMSPEDYDRLVPSDTSSDNPQQFYLENYAGVTAQPASALTIGIASSDSSDSSNVIISGYDSNNNYIVESLALTGTSIAATTNSFKHIANVSKKETTGSITISNSGGTITYLILNPNENTIRIPVIGLYPIPNKVITIYGRAYETIPSLQYAYETPVGLPEYTLNAIIANAFARFSQYDPKQNTMSRESLWQLANTEFTKLIKSDAKTGVQYRVKQPVWSAQMRQYFRPLANDGK